MTSAIVRATATAATGTSTERMSGDARRVRWTSDTDTAAKTTIVSVSRSGRTTSSKNPATAFVTMNAWAGHASSQVANGDGSGNGASSTAGSQRIAMIATTTANRRLSERCSSRPDGNAS